MGISSWLLYHLINKDTDPLSPENPLIFGVDPLTGTLAPGASRVVVHSRSPNSGLIAQANAGHSMGIMMKYSGYDVLVITGRAPNPVYLKISDDVVELVDASHLWGKDTWETTDLLHKELNDYWIDCVGPAAERAVRYAIILCSKRSSFNKTGTGTVMGSKNLKAIVARGTKGIRIADPTKFLRIANALTKRIIADSELSIIRQFGGVPRSPPGFPYQEFIKRVGESPYACLSCPVADKHLIALSDGKYQGAQYRISHLSAQANRHSRPAGIENWDELIKCAEVENRYGIEASTAASVLNFLNRCYDHNLWDGVLLDGSIDFVPQRGGAALRQLLTLINQRADIGDQAAEGMLQTSEKIHSAEHYTAHIKGVGREHQLEKGASLGTIGSLTNPRGGKGDMTGGGVVIGTNPTAFRRFCSDLGLGTDVANRVCNGGNGFHVGRLVKWAEDYTTAYLSLGFCTRPILMRHLTLDEISQLYEAATGFTINTPQLLTTGERIFNVLKAINVKFGATRADDLPSRGWIWPPDKPIVANGRDYGSLNHILNQYYDERGWNIETGLPTRQKLIALGLQEIADTPS
jgi:aldehyde:ferredoxin oxidoreductase